RRRRQHQGGEGREGTHGRAHRPPGAVGCMRATRRQSEIHGKAPCGMAAQMYRSSGVLANWSAGTQTDNLIGGHGSMESLQAEVADVAGLDDLPDESEAAFA